MACKPPAAAGFFSSRARFRRAACSELLFKRVMLGEFGSRERRGGYFATSSYHAIINGLFFVFYSKSAMLAAIIRLGKVKEMARFL